MHDEHRYLTIPRAIAWACAVVLVALLLMGVGTKRERIYVDAMFVRIIQTDGSAMG